MSGWFTILSEIKYTWHESATKVPIPNMIDCDSSDQRIVTRRHPLGKRRAAATTLLRINRRQRRIIYGGSIYRFLFGFFEGLARLFLFLFRIRRILL